MTATYTLGKQERLKSRKQIELLFSKGRHFHVPLLRILYRIHPDSATPQASLKAGFTVSARHFKKATDRNRIRRLLRESWRLQKNALRDRVMQAPQSLDIFIIYTGREIPSFEEVYPLMGTVIEKLSEHYVKEA